MWFTLPNELRTLIFDFFGDVSIRKHRLHRFVCAELATLNCIANFTGRTLRPATIPRVDTFKQICELGYLKAQRKALFESITIDGYVYPVGNGIP